MSGTVRESPADFRNGDLISRLLAATPPYQTNSTFVPPGLYFSEMLKRFVQAKSCPPLPPPQSLHCGRRGRKRSWKDHYGGAGGGCNNKGPPSSAADQSEGGKAQQKKRADFAPSVPATVSEPHLQFPLWYPPFYSAAAYPPPVYFETPDAEPLNLRTRGSADPPPVQHKLQQDGHCSAFRVPEPGGGSGARPDRAAADGAADDDGDDDNRRGTSYLMGHLTEIYKRAAVPPSADDERIIDVEGDGPEPPPPPRALSVDADEKKSGGSGSGKDLTALIGLELVVDYVKHGRGKGDANDRTVGCCRNSSA